MNEVQRQAYLKVMGIQTYFPKSILVGAKPSPVYEIPLEDQQKSDQAGRKKTSARRERSSAEDILARGTTPSAVEGLKTASLGTVKKSITASLGKVLAQTQSEAAIAADLSSPGLELANQEKPNAAATSETQINSEEATELRFKLRYFRISEKLAIIDEVPHQKSERLTRDDQALLQAILAALKLDTSDTDLRPESFSWPLAENLSMKNHPSEEAKRALSGFVKMRQETDRFPNLLIFAAQIDSLLVKQKNGIEIRDFKATSSDYFITVTSSLQSMLVCPALKRDVWQHLQPLSRRLAESE